MQIDVGFIVALVGVSISVGTLMVSARKSDVEKVSAPVIAGG